MQLNFLGMHKPNLNPDLKMWGEHMREAYENEPEPIIKKWLPIADKVFKDFNFENLNYVDQKMILFYIEWMSYFDNIEPYSVLAENIHSLKEIIINYINSDEVNFDIVSEVYNPILDRVRYKVKKGSDIVIMDNLNKEDKHFLIHLLPHNFLEAIGMKQYLREKKLDNILENND